MVNMLAGLLSGLSLSLDLEDWPDLADLPDPEPEESEESSLWTWEVNVNVETVLEVVQLEE